MTLRVSIVNARSCSTHCRTRPPLVSAVACIAALVQLVEDIKKVHHETFILECQLIGDIKIITLQSNYMKTVLHEHASALQSDTMEGVILEPDWSNPLSIHFTSQYDQVIQR